jgi:hypothetical protein
MARSDDLVPFLTSKPAPGVGFRQGVIVAWDQDTAENTVLVGGTVMTDLPILNSTEASLLEPGDVVGVQTFGNTWAILGRFVFPGTPQAVSAIQSITNRIQATEDVAGGTRNSTSFGDLTGADVGPSVTVRIGSSGRALVFWSAEIGQTSPNQWSVRNTPHVGVEVTQGVTVIHAASATNALNVALEYPASPAAGNAASTFWVQAAMMHVYPSIPVGDTTFTMKYKHDTITPAASSLFQAREIAVFAL